MVGLFYGFVGAIVMFVVSGFAAQYSVRLAIIAAPATLLLYSAIVALFLAKS